MENLARQRQEVEVLRSIYGDQWQEEDSTTNTRFSVHIGDNCEVVLYITLVPDYPSDAPPIYEISAPTLNRTCKQKINFKLANISSQNIGETLIYQWVEEIREFLHHTNNHKKKKEHNSNLGVPRGELSTKSELHIIHGEVITDRKSSFQGHAAEIKSVNQVQQMLSILLDNKKIKQAKHNIYAYRICKAGPAVVAQDSCDDGERAAGGRLLHLLQHLQGPTVAMQSLASDPYRTLTTASDDTRKNHRQCRGPHQPLRQNRGTPRHPKCAPVKKQKDKTQMGSKRTRGGQNYPRKEKRW